MGIRDTFCPRCGRPSDGICETCRGVATPWVWIEPRITVFYCPTCGALKEKGGWLTIPGEREDLT
ncbi:MAG: 60S ribosomal export protein NMD3, partial [Methanomicrobiales archaeon]|nr:60S ribosomal export protein NMD3 [Methanomicrobiales archaeon]